MNRSAEDIVDAQCAVSLAAVRAAAAGHPVIATDTDPTPPRGIVRPCPATRGGSL